ncbi:MAG: hypothetical protein ACJ790_00370 [Myxococcaceae bacterium]
MILPALALSLFAQLPPNHPNVDGKLPPNHPQLGAQEQGQLPPNHPKLGADQQQSDQLPEQHPPVALGAPSVEELLTQLDAAGDLKNRDKPFEVAAGIAKLYYAASRRPEALEFFRQADAKAEEARKTYVELRKRAFATKTPPASACEESPKSLDDAVKRSKELSKGNLSLAVACLRKALDPVLEGETMMGHTLFVQGDPAGALSAYRRVLEISDAHDEALFGEGVLLLETKGDDAKSLAQAKTDFDRYVQLYPSGARVDRARSLSARVLAASNAGGLSKLSPQPPVMAAQNNLGPPPLSREQMEAAQNIPKTPEMEAAFGKVMDEAEEHLAKGEFQQALDSYKQVMPSMPNNPRAQAGMAWSLIGLNKQPMADRVWGVAVGTSPAAIDQLGDVLAKKGDSAGAKKLWAKLKETAPDYASSSGLAKKIE